MWSESVLVKLGVNSQMFYAYGPWQHPRSKHVHLLDYIVTRRANIADFLSTRVVRGAECGTDHFMVRSLVAFSIEGLRSTGLW